MNAELVADKLLGIPTEKRDAWFELLRDPVFKPVYNYKNLADQRAHPFKRLQKIFGAKLVSVKEFQTNPHNVFSSHEFVGLIDGSTAIKHTV
jgi:acyl-CoA oxidase